MAVDYSGFSVIVSSPASNVVIAAAVAPKSRISFPALQITANVHPHSLCHRASRQ